LGVVLSEQKKFDKAVECFIKTLQLQPDNAVVHLHLGIVYKQQKLLQKAKYCFEQAINLKPDYDMAHYNLGVIYSQQANIEKALDCFRQALYYEPEHTQCQTALLFSLSALPGVTTEEVLQTAQAWYEQRQARTDTL
jgi:tetratricopeptide (TPR) repeat protein